MHLFLINAPNKAQRGLAYLKPTSQKRKEAEFREAKNLPKITRQISAMKIPI